MSIITFFCACDATITAIWFCRLPGEALQFALKHRPRSSINNLDKTTIMPTNMQETIRNKLVNRFSPEFLDLVNESNNHNVAPGSESHFRVTLVCEAFEGITLIQRHRLVNECLKQELAGQIHALALHTFTRDQWASRQQQSPESPDCLGGEK